MPHSVADWRPAMTLSARKRALLWLGAMGFTALAVVLTHTTSRMVGPVSAAPAVGMADFLWLVVAWTSPHRRWLIVGGTLIAILFLPTLVCVPLGTDPMASLRSSLGCLVQGVVTLLVYRSVVGSDDLTPHRPRDLVGLLIGALLGSIAAIGIGPAPSLSIATPLRELTWWVILSGTYVFVVGACALLLCFRRADDEANSTRPLDVYVQMVVTGVCLGAVFAFPEVKLSWLVILPAIWAGMTLGPWVAAAFGLTMFAAAVAAELVEHPYGISYDAPLPAVVLLNVLMTSFVFVVLLLSLLRDQRARLVEEVVARRQESIDQGNLLGEVFEAMSDGLIIFDRAGRVHHRNAAARRVLGQTLIKEQVRRWLARPTQASPWFTEEIPPVDEDGETRHLAVHIGTVRYSGAPRIVAIVRDITTEQLRLEELASFAAVAAHDLKGPISTIQGWMEVAEDALGSDDQLAAIALSRGKAASARMSREIDDWLAYNVAREGVLAPEPVDIGREVARLAPTYPDAALTIATHEQVLADPVLVTHLISNLIGNAVKYTHPDRRPEITVRAVRDDHAEWVRVEVIDRGIGIPEGEETDVFAPFARASVVVDSHDGSGLGLALCKRIVTRHGGTISARRNPDVGTTVTFTLPRAVAVRSSLSEVLEVVRSARDL